MFVYQEYLNSINLHHLGEELIYHSDFVTADYILKLKIIEMIESKMLSQLKRAVQTDNKYLEDYLQSLGLFRSLSTLSEDDIEELVNKGMEQILDIEKGSK